MNADAKGSNVPALPPALMQQLQHLVGQGAAVDPQLNQPEAPPQPPAHPQGQLAPAMFWNPWQLQGIPGAAALGPQMAQMAAQPVVAQTALAELVTAAVTAAMRPFLPEKQANLKGQALNAKDEQILIDALKRAKAGGLTIRQALEKLDKVSLSGVRCPVGDDEADG